MGEKAGGGLEAVGVEELDLDEGVGGGPVLLWKGHEGEKGDGAVQVRPVGIDVVPGRMLMSAR